MKKHNIKKHKDFVINPKVKNMPSKESEKALARADDDGFALPEKKRSKNNYEKQD